MIDQPNECGPALVSPVTAEQLGCRGTKFLLELAEGSDCVLTAAVAAAGEVADGAIAVTAVQQHNLHLGAGCSEDFR